MRTAPYVTIAGDIAPDLLATLRVAAMRPSLEALGRFDPDRARDRFLASYSPQNTRLIYAQDELAGFFVARALADHMLLDHLYIHPRFQGQKLGHWIMDVLRAEALAARLPIKLMALKESAANQFYMSCGFAFASATEFDNHYIWTPKT